MLYFVSNILSFVFLECLVVIFFSFSAYIYDCIWLVSSLTLRQVGSDMVENMQVYSKSMKLLQDQGGDTKTDNKAFYFSQNFAPNTISEEPTIFKKEKLFGSCTN